MGANRAKEIFLDLIELERDARPAALAAACDGDEELRARVERLLADYEQADRIVPGAVLPTAEPIEDAPRPGERLGNYRVLRVLGEGGFGTVFLVEQEAPIVRRAALKLIRSGKDTEQAVARFEAERQALALMSHPGIAQVFDADQLDDGRPYFVMEYVDGASLIAGCDERRLDLRARLDLFVDVCRTVQHAHQKGIIHRDLKPENVLVFEEDGRPRVKIIDFGIAKALGENRALPSLTADDQIVGTLAFMAPEQARGASAGVDTRTDVYSLGVLLYHLLTGGSPYSDSDLGIAQWTHAICNREPIQPSRRVVLDPESAWRAAEARGTDPETLRRGLVGDLDWILLRALEKDPEQRYQTADALAADLERHRRHEPVEAGPPGSVYRLRKFARRHRAVSILVLVLAVATVVSGSAAWIAKESRDDAHEALAHSRYQTYLASVYSAQAALDDYDSATARDLLDQAPAEFRGWEWDHIQGRLDGSDLVLTTGKPGKAEYVAMHPSGDRVALQWEDGTLNVFDGHDGSLLHSWAPYESKVSFLVGSVSGDTLLASSIAGEVARWSWDGEIVTRYSGPKDRPSVLVESPDGVRTYASCLDGAVHVWDSASGEPIGRLEHGVPVERIVVSPDGRRVASSSWDQLFRLWNAEDHALISTSYAARAVTAREPARLYAPGEVTAMEFSPDSKELLVGTRDGLLTLWGAEDGTRLWSYRAAHRLIRRVAWRPDGERFAAASYDWTLSLFDPRTRELIVRLTDHDHDVRNTVFTDSNLLLSCSWDKSIRVWHADYGQPLATLLGHGDLVYGFALSKDARRVATHSEDRTVRVWSLADVGRGTLVGTRHFVVDAVFLDPYTILASHSEDPVRIWDLRATPPTSVQLPGSNDVRRCVSVQASSDRFAFADPEGTAQLWEIAERRRLSAFPVGSLTALHLAPDGTRIFGGDEAGALSCWDAEDGALLWRVEGHARRVTGMEQLRDGRLVSCGLDASVQLRSPGSGELVRAIEVPFQANDVAQHPETNLIAVALENREIVLVDADTGETTHRLTGHGDRVTSVRWLPDGSRLLSSSLDRTLRLWDPTTGEHMLTLRGHSGSIYNCAVSPDGTRILSCGSDGSIRTWKATR